ncbi:secretory lipase-domain-containing protein [Aspergillus unguis]
MFQAILILLLFRRQTACSPIRPQDPSVDPFYQPPAGFESQPLGAILRQRTITAAFFGLVPDPVDSYQLLYRTTAINGSAIAAVTTIFKPSRSITDRFISYHTAYDSASVLCNPSYQYQLGVAPTDGLANLEFVVLQQHLLAGYIVASPDHEGPDAALGAGRLAGMMVLDGMRAVINFQDLGLSTLPTIIGEGYSGGAIATGWGAALQASYAPELNVKGWAMGGTPSNLTGTFLFLDNTTYSGFNPAAVDGLVKPSAYGAQLQPVLDAIITPKGQEILDYANSHCAPADLMHFANQSMFSTDLQVLGRDLLQEPTINRIINDNLLGGIASELPMAPLLIYHAIQDNVIPYSYIPPLVDAWCKQGVSIQFKTYTTGGHVKAFISALPDKTKFIADAFTGDISGGCS